MHNNYIQDYDLLLKMAQDRATLHFANKLKCPCETLFDKKAQQACHTQKQIRKDVHRTSCVFEELALSNQ